MIHARWKKADKQTLQQLISSNPAMNIEESAKCVCGILTAAVQVLDDPGLKSIALLDG